MTTTRFAFLALSLMEGYAQTAGLPIQRVVLYKNGVGYFEHLGKVTGAQKVEIGFTSGQLNDVLKSLTVLDLNGGRIAGVGYGSANPVERQLGDLRLPVSEKPTLTELLGALRGARVEVRNGAMAITGRLLSVERKTRTGGGTTLEVDSVALLTEAGEVKTTEVSPQFSVRLLEKDLTGKLDRWLDIQASVRAADSRKMTIATEGTGERSLHVSYISEVPVWKTTYRLVLSGKRQAKPLLQGWAIVDNTVGEDWTNVKLSLVAGAPQSFVQNLSTPLYARRPEVAMRGGSMVTPQTHEQAIFTSSTGLAGVVTDPVGSAVAGASVKVFDVTGRVVGQTNTDASGRYELASLPASTVRLEVSSTGFRTQQVAGITVGPGMPVRQDVTMNLGSVSETVEVRAAAPELQTSSSVLAARRRMQNMPPPPPPPPSYTAEQARALTQAAATGAQLGDLFEYQVKEPVTIAKGSSALVPIVQSAMEAEKISLWNERDRTGRPLRALWLTNTSGMTLDGGTFSVLEEETFAGEGLIEAMQPGEKRLVSYAVDLALTTGAASKAEPERVRKIRVAKGVLTEERELRESKTYTFRNEDTAGRTVIVEHAARPGYKLSGNLEPAETTAGWMRFRVPVGAKQTASLVVNEVKPEMVTYQMAECDEQMVALFVLKRAMNAELEKQMRAIIALRRVVDDLDQEKETREREAQEITGEQERIRENMGALKGSAEERALLQRYTRTLNAQEDRLEELKKQLAELNAKIGEADKKVEDAARAVALEFEI